MVYIKFLISKFGCEERFEVETFAFEKLVLWNGGGGKGFW